MPLKLTPRPKLKLKHSNIPKMELGRPPAESWDYEELFAVHPKTCIEIVKAALLRCEDLRKANPKFFDDKLGDKTSPAGRLIHACLALEKIMSDDDIPF